MKTFTNITPNFVTSLKDNEIFVFGSNIAGWHGGGAAKQAMEWGAVWGQGEGLQGQTYAIPTMFDTVAEIAPYVNRFLDFARQHGELKFLVTAIGCGIAGFDAKDIAPLFAAAVNENMQNVWLPDEFVKAIAN